MTHGIIPKIIDIHTEEAAFLWLLRDSAAGEPHYTLADLVRLDGRLEAHLDGLRVAGEAGWEIVKTALVEIGEPGEVFTAGVLAFESKDEKRIAQVLETGMGSSEAARSLIAAMDWVRFEQVSPWVKRLQEGKSSLEQSIGLAAAAVHRRNPGPGLITAFASDDPALKARALRTVGELGLPGAQPTLSAGLKSKDRAIRFWAAWSSTLLSNHKDSVLCLQAIAESGGAFAERAASMAMRRLPPREGKLWLRKLAHNLGQVRAAIRAAGSLADADALAFLLDLMSDPRHARPAGESFSLITGAQIAYDSLEGATPEGFEAGPTEDPDDEDVAMDPDLNLPWPDPTLVRKWWNARKGSFAQGVRHLLGQPITPDSARQAIKNGYQRQRAAAAIELAILKPGQPLFEVRAPGPRQQGVLS